MVVTKIYYMYWDNPEHTTVGLLADTNEGDNLLIGTPYNDTSIIWDAVSAYPEDQILDNPPPPIE
jgi:hypothetical protein